VSVDAALAGFLFVSGGLMLAAAYANNRRPALAQRLARAQTRTAGTGAHAPEVPDWVARLHDHYVRQLRQAGGSKSLRRVLQEKALVAIAAPIVVVLPYAAATGQQPSLALIAILALAGSFVPDLALRQEIRSRREAIFLDLPEVIAIIGLALRAGQSLRQALELAARDCAGPLAHELERTLTMARRERGIDERDALVRIAHQAGEPTFARFAELLAAKESPYVEFLQQQAREARAAQSRYLERAADRAYLAMHAPLAPLLAVLVLLLAYGFLRFLAHTV
jgi:tight adherence protein C